MDCTSFPVWIGIVIGIVVVTLVLVIIVINRKWNAIKYLLFIRFNVLINDDVPENVDELEFDAFIIYRFVNLQCHYFS